MPLSIDRAALVEALRNQDPASAYYLLDRETGTVVHGVAEVVETTSDDIDGLDTYDPDRYLRIDPVSQATALSIKHDFASNIMDPSAASALRKALAGKNPVRSFRETLQDYDGLRDAWSAYANKAYEVVALTWLEEEGVDAELTERP